jgi:hypothetical protein
VELALLLIEERGADATNTTPDTKSYGTADGATSIRGLCGAILNIF